MKRCVIICGAPDADVDFIKQTVNISDDFVICADSGYAYAKNAGIRPNLIVGDFDSFSGDLPEDVPRETLETHKDDTDSMHCAAVSLKHGYKEIVLLAAVGGRLDHTLANISVLQYLVENGAKAVILSENEEIFYLAHGRHIFNNIKGKTFSVLPFGCSEVTVTYDCEVEYPAQKLRILSSVAVGVSNIFLDNNAEVVIESGATVLIIENNV